jgi:hypothetical protein
VLKSVEQLQKHALMSDLHKKNMEIESYKRIGREQRSAVETQLADARRKQEAEEKHARYAPAGLSGPPRPTTSMFRLLLRAFEALVEKASKVEAQSVNKVRLPWSCSSRVADSFPSAACRDQQGQQDAASHGMEVRAGPRQDRFRHC